MGSDIALPGLGCQEACVHVASMASKVMSNVLLNLSMRHFAERIADKVADLYNVTKGPPTQIIFTMCFAIVPYSCPVKHVIPQHSDLWQSEELFNNNDKLGAGNDGASRSVERSLASPRQRCLVPCNTPRCIVDRFGA